MPKTLDVPHQFFVSGQFMDLSPHHPVGASKYGWWRIFAAEPRRFGSHCIMAWRRPHHRDACWGIYICTYKYACVYIHIYIYIACTKIWYNWISLYIRVRITDVGPIARPLFKSFVIFIPFVGMENEILTCNHQPNTIRRRRPKIKIPDSTCVWVQIWVPNI
jgi:hypothetical protein